MSEPIDLLGLGFAEFAELARNNLPGGRGAAGALYERAFVSGRLDFEGLGLSDRNRRAWEELFTVGLLRPGELQAEAGDFGRTEKALLFLKDGGSIECVNIPTAPRPDGRSRSTLCVSSQVGCRMGCAFCETGRAGLSRNLSAAEIVSQLVTTRVLFGWDPKNIVFMGMGEPLDNLEGLRGALAVFTDARGPAFSWERLTVCTSGLAEGIVGLRDFTHPRLNLSLSLNAADDEKRSRLMPANRGSNLGALAEVLRLWPRRRNFVLALNWCLMPGINDSREDAKKAAAYAAGLGRTIVNLIPYNPGRAPLTRAPTEEEIEGFALRLEEEGCLVKRRTKRGSRIMAACGQLGGRHDRGV